MAGLASWKQKRLRFVKRDLAAPAHRSPIGAATASSPSSSKMVVPRLLGNRRVWEGSTASFFLLQLLLSAVGAKEETITADFDVRPGGMVHSDSKSLGDYTCTFTYAAQGGTNEQWQMSIGVSEDNLLFSCSIWRPQGKSYLFFTQFKAEVKGAKIQYAMAYSKAGVGEQKDIPLKEEEFFTTERTVAHREGKFHSELSKVLIVAEKSHDEL
ncbi:myeloid-derived growth factor isoform X2 [Python bivittatus]|uniref:Myeloid-derived growth factor isoform X2 n=1 Tax=Python bivittatus TaxID=176946 RepID=A0A9F2R8E1_PYTBI|nr:myeloid-derived growth factor isoform X2 [Python bivittatus]